MKIAITNPTNWPHVRRGAERFLNDLAFYMAGCGHQVTVVSAKPGPREIRNERGYTTILHRRLWHPWMWKLGVLEFHVFTIPLLLHLLRDQSFDVIHACTFVDGFVASLTRRRTGIPCVLWVNGMPPRVPYYRTLTTGGRLFRRAITSADEVIALSAYMRDYLEGRFGRRALRIPVAVDVDQFKLNRERDHERPIILCAAALDDRRKGGRVILQAFDRLKETHPGAVLKVSCPLAAEARSALISQVTARWRGDVHFLGAGDLQDLPGLYGRASVSVLASLWEGFGMVVIESLATGTPVVCTRDGALPELIDRPGIGRLFDPGGDPATISEATNVEGLVQALRETLELSRRPETALACRARAEEYRWQHVGPRFEQVYQKVISASQARSVA